MGEEGVSLDEKAQSEEARSDQRDTLPSASSAITHLLPLRRRRFNRRRVSSLASPP